jgi:hypothetical protein
MEVTRSKVLGLIIALSYLATAIAMAGWDAEGVAIMSLCLSVPVAFIWFPDEIGAFTDIVARGGWGRINTETPPFMISLSGWLFLVVVFPLIAYLLLE